MHAVALGYPSDPSEYQKLAYRTFYAGLGEVIPCQSCSASYRRMMHKRGGLSSLDAALDDPSDCQKPCPLFDWTVWIHNAVNLELGKPSSWTPERARVAVLRGGTEGAQAPSSFETKNDRLIGATWKAMAAGFIFASAFAALCVAFYLVAIRLLRLV